MAALIEAISVKRRTLFEFENVPYSCLEAEVSSPTARGDTASGGATKKATLETGLEIRVPLFVKEGETVRVATETREFAGRA